MRNADPSVRWPAAGGTTGALIRNFGPDATPLGPPEQWPRTLRQVIDLILPSPAQMAVFWGPQCVAFYNDAYAATLGNKHPAALGRPAGEPSPEVWTRVQSTFESVRQSGRAIGARDSPFVVNRKGREETLFFDFAWSPVAGDGGEVDGVLCVIAETTERVRAARTLAVNERRAREEGERMRLAQAAGRIGGFVLDLQTELLQVSGAFCEIFGVPPSDTPALADIQALRIDHDPRLSIRAAVAAGLEPPDLEFRVRRADDGALRWIARHAAVVCDGVGKPVLLRGAVLDITDYKEAELRLHKSEARFRALTGVVPGLVLVVDADGQIQWASERLCAYVGLDLSDIAGKYWHQAVHPDDGPRVASEWARALASDGALDLEVRLLRHDGAWRRHWARTRPVDAHRGAAAPTWIAILFDVEEPLGGVLPQAATSAPA